MIIRPSFLYKKFIFFLLICILCTSFSSNSHCNSEINNTDVPGNRSFEAEKPFDKIIILETDLKEKEYIVIGEIEVQVNRFEPQCRNLSLVKMKQFAFSMGADAVIFVTFSTEGDFSTSDKLFVKGIAVRFK
ncbi:MAG: hypothetical protein KAI43_01720 [Candidatus Aureabacteria bacterium]|nr:hypothetical protein [Candidatus Auribacterota bacterium]